MNGFGSYHPAILFLYYVLALAFSMVSLHPVLVAAALTGSFFFYAMQKGVVKMLHGSVVFRLSVSDQWRLSTRSSSITVKQSCFL